MIVDIDLVKIHLRVDTTVEDDLIQLYMEAAEDWIRNYIDDCDALPDENYGEVPSAIKNAFLMLVGDSYLNREAAGEVEIKENPAVLRLLRPYRKNMGV